MVIFRREGDDAGVSISVVRDGEMGEQDLELAGKLGPMSNLVVKVLLSPTTQKQERQDVAPLDVHRRSVPDLDSAMCNYVYDMRRAINDGIFCNYVVTILTGRFRQIKHQHQSANLGRILVGVVSQSIQEATILLVDNLVALASPMTFFNLGSLEHVSDLVLVRRVFCKLDHAIHNVCRGNLVPLW